MHKVNDTIVILVQKSVKSYMEVSDTD